MEGEEKIDLFSIGITALCAALGEETGSFMSYTSPSTIYWDNIRNSLSQLNMNGFSATIIETLTALLNSNESARPSCFQLQDFLNHNANNIKSRLYQNLMSKGPSNSQFGSTIQPSIQTYSGLQQNYELGALVSTMYATTPPQNPNSAPYPHQASPHASNLQTGANFSQNPQSTKSTIPLTPTYHNQVSYMDSNYRSVQAANSGHSTYNQPSGSTLSGVHLNPANVGNSVLAQQLGQQQGSTLTPPSLSNNFPRTSNSNLSRDQTNGSSRQSNFQAYPQALPTALPRTLESSVNPVQQAPTGSFIIGGVK